MDFLTRRKKDSFFFFFPFLRDSTIQFISSFFLSFFSSPLSCPRVPFTFASLYLLLYFLFLSSIPLSFLLPPLSIPLPFYWDSFSTGKLLFTELILHCYFCFGLFYPRDYSSWDSSRLSIHCIAVSVASPRALAVLINTSNP